MIKKLVILCIAVIAAQAVDLPFIQKCSLSDPKLEECFVKNGNTAIEVLKEGNNLAIPALDGFSPGNLLFNVKEDLSVLFEDVKIYPVAAKLENARLHFRDGSSELEKVHLLFSLQDISWQFKYSALGFFNNHKINEHGFAHLHFGHCYGNYSAEFKRIVVNDIPYLRVHHDYGKIKNNRFAFVPSDVKTVGQPLEPEQLHELENLVIERAVDLSKEYVSFAFDKVLQEIPANEIFLP